MRRRESCLAVTTAWTTQCLTLYNIFAIFELYLCNICTIFCHNCSSHAMFYSMFLQYFTCLYKSYHILPDPTISYLTTSAFIAYSRESCLAAETTASSIIQDLTLSCFTILFCVFTFHNIIHTVSLHFTTAAGIVQAPFLTSISVLLQCA